jgi:hypothetical protein
MSVSSVRPSQAKEAVELSGNAAIISQRCWNNKIEDHFMSMQQGSTARPGNSADTRDIPA